MTAPRRVAEVGGGWAGLAAAVRLVERGAAVTLFEMAPRPGGRARSLAAAAGDADPPLDNGQHILIGAYRDTLALMATVGADPATLLARGPLALVGPDGRGLRLPAASPLAAFARGVLAHRGWPLAAKAALLATAGGWALRGFRCDPALSAQALCARLPRVLKDELIDPLCVAALNTPADQASAAVFLRVLRDALFSGQGSADLLLPRAPLQALLPDPAWRWLQARGAALHCGRRVGALQRMAGGWQLDGGEAPFDAVVLACSAEEAARLAAPHAPAWSATAAAMPYEPIVTVYATSAGSRLPQAMTAMPGEPAQFVFDHGQLCGPAGRFAFVVSGARTWVERGLDATTEAVLAQAATVFPSGTWAAPLQPLRTVAEKRATFACRPDLARPPAAVAPRLVAAGDYVDGPYPATLEGAVRSGLAAAAAVL